MQSSVRKQDSQQATIAPHGGTLVDRRLPGEVPAAVLEQARSLPRIQLDALRLSDLELIATGAASPLTGFMTEKDYRYVVNDMHLVGGQVWTLPIVLPVTHEVAAELHVGQSAALCEGERTLAIIEITDKYEYDKEHEAREVYQTTDQEHPGVARLYAQCDVLLGGEVWVLNLPSAAVSEFVAHRHTPQQTRQLFVERDWRRVVGFQTRNPIHRAHEYIQKTALEIADGLLLHPLVGETKPRRYSSRRAHGFIRSAAPIVLSGESYATGRIPGGHALCRSARGCVPCAAAQELWLYSLHCRTRSRRRRKLLWHLCCPTHIR
jgi:sulfate adenylyltransferase